MFQLKEFLNGLDNIYKAGTAACAEPYLKQGLKDAAASHDEGAILVILNELMGYYRAAGQYEPCLLCTRQALSLARGMGLEGTLNYGTTLLNAATAYRAAGHEKEALTCYQETKNIYDKFLQGPDYRKAALHNNISLLYSETGKPELAKKELEEAMKEILLIDNSFFEQAITHTNLGYLCLQLKKNSEGIQHMKEALRLFELQPDHKDSHYAAALAGMGQAYYQIGQLADSVRMYQKALKEIRQTYGENEYYQTTLGNLRMVDDQLKRHTWLAENGIHGMELSKKYFHDLAIPVLEKKYSKYLHRIAAGLVGEGSECFGYDDVYSSDHDFGPGFCIWLSKEDYQEIASQLTEDYNLLPKEYGGFPSRNTTSQGRDRVGVFEIEAFYETLLHAPLPKTEDDWMDLSEEYLACTVNGTVFRDPLGEFTGIRHFLAYYPKNIWLKKLSICLGILSQAGQYNYERAAKRQELGAMYFSHREFCSEAVHAVYLLNKTYMPFYKWKFTGVRNLKILNQIIPVLETLMTLNVKDQAEEITELMEKICLEIAQELRRQKLSRLPDSFLKNHIKEIQKLLLIEQIVEEEWKQFQRVNNTGGRASCQDNYPTFEIMRKSQFLTWDINLLSSYCQDLKDAKEKDWNLLTEKYARMMESTALEEYIAFEGILPFRSFKRLEAQENVIQKEIQWAENFAVAYPVLAGRGRLLHTSEDSPWDTSMETYLRGELSTYSDRTFLLYQDMIHRYDMKGENLTELKLKYMIEFYGYETLDQAEEAMKQ